MKTRTINLIVSLFLIILLLSYFGIRQNQNSDFNNLLNTTEQNIKDEKWNKAKENSLRITEKWENLKFMVLLNYASEDISLVDEYVKQLEASTETKDSMVALSSTYIIKDLWKNMQKVIPQP